MSPTEENGEHQRDVRLKRLHKGCELTLARYTTLANDTCSMAAKLRILPMSKDKRLEMSLQKKREDEAHQAYQKARNALFAAIEEDTELLDPRPGASPASAVQGMPRFGPYRRRS
jgi:hypothetical protein